MSWMHKQKQCQKKESFVKKNGFALYPWKQEYSFRFDSLYLEAPIQELYDSRTSECSNQC